MVKQYWLGWRQIWKAACKKYLTPSPCLYDVYRPLCLSFYRAEANQRSPKYKRTQKRSWYNLHGPGPDLDRTEASASRRCQGKRSDSCRYEPRGDSALAGCRRVRIADIQEIMNSHWQLTTETHTDTHHTSTQQSSSIWNGPSLHLARITPDTRSMTLCQTYSEMGKFLVYFHSIDTLCSHSNQKCDTLHSVAFSIVKMLKLTWKSHLTVY